MKSPLPTRQAQRGSIIVNATIAMSLMVILLIGSELGYLFFLKRELQKTADLAALAGATSVTTSNCSAGRTAALNNANNATTGNMPTGLSPLVTGEVACGTWTSAGTVTDPASRFTSATSNLNAVQVQFSRTPVSLLAFFTGSRTISVHAVAAKALPAASLSIRSTLITIDQSKSDLLNAVVGGLLGGSINPPVTVLGWQGLVNTNVSLLDLLVQLGASAGTYDSVLQTNLTVKQLIDATLAVAQRNGSTATAAITALQSLSTAANVAGLPQIKLGTLLGVATGTPSTGLDLDLQVFQLIQGSVQLANGSSAVAATIPITVPGVAAVTAQVKVIEKPQISAIGNPDLITPSLGTSDPNRIYVRTAQVRSLFSINLGSQTSTSNALQTVLNSVTSALSPLANFLASVTNASLPSVVGSIVSAILPCAPCTSSRVLYAQVLSSKIDLSLDAASASAYVTGHTCTNDTTKSLTVQPSTSIANLRVGSISNAFSSSQTISVAPISVVDIGYQETRYESCLIPLLGILTCYNQTWKTTSGAYVAGQSNGAKTVIAGLGLKLDSSVGSSTPSPLTYSAPISENLPEIDAAVYSGTGADPSYKSISSQSLVNSLSSTLSGITLTAYSSPSGGLLGTLLTGTISLVNALLSTLQSTITSLLSPLLDPTVNALLDTLGINLAKADVGARLSCSRGVELVY